MKRLFSNKKGVEFLPLLLVFMVPFLVYLSIVIVGGIDDSGYAVGQMSKDLFDSYDDSYKLDTYIHNAAKLAVSKSIMQNSDNLFNSTCGEYMGYVMVNNESDECFKNHKEKFTTNMIKNLDDSLQKIDTEIEFEITVTKVYPLEIIGESGEIPIPIYKDETIN